MQYSTWILSSRYENIELVYCWQKSYAHVPLYTPNLGWRVYAAEVVYDLGIFDVFFDVDVA